MRDSISGVNLPSLEIFDSLDIYRLYDNVLREDIVRYGVTEQEIRRGVQVMAYAYRPEPNSLQLDTVNAANFNDIGLRCAYLHKCAAFHTALVIHAMNKILKNHRRLFEKLVMTGQFKLCCLGGGPGSDAIGILASLSFAFGIFKKDVVIIDIMENWKFTFEALVQQIIYGNYSIQQNFLRDYFQWNYIGLNLLGNMTDPANTAIGKANFISMVKFVSAAACQDTESMVTKIFKVMKPGALVLFIDNAAGGFHELVRRAADQVGLITIFGPLNHYNYTDEVLKSIRFGYTSCFSTKVSIHLLRKPYQNQKTKNYNPSRLQQNSNAPTVISHEPLSNVNTFLNSKLYSPYTSASLDKNTNVNKSCYSNEINSAKHNVSPTKSEKFNKQLAETSKRVVPKSVTQTSYSISEPVSPVYSESSRSSAQCESDAFHGYSDYPDDGCCSCCVIS